MIRIFSRYVPSRALLFLIGEIAITCGSFALAVLIRFGVDSPSVLNDTHTISVIAVIAVLALLCSHFLESHDFRWLVTPTDKYPQVFLLIGSLSLLLSALTYFVPTFVLGREVFLTGLLILGLSWLIWRWIYGRILFLPSLRQKVYVLGNGERAQTIINAIRTRAELGMDLVGWAGFSAGEPATAESIASTLQNLAIRRAVDQVIVALTDRRSVMPMNELLELRLSGVQVEDGTSLLEKISGKIEVDELHPSWLIFGDGFRLGPTHRLVRRALSIVLAVLLTVITFPLIPIIALLIKLSSPGPVLYRQKRVGLRGCIFDCYKFRTMRADAEADSGATWASDEDPRVTTVGRFLRRTRLDEIPQIWNVLRGDMAFVGPRPERPEFVGSLSKQIPYYGLRHLTRPGITGWAQINYGYGASVEETKEKLRYDLYYIRNVSVPLDLLIVFYTLRAVILGRGVR